MRLLWSCLHPYLEEEDARPLYARGLRRTACLTEFGALLLRTSEGCCVRVYFAGARERASLVYRQSWSEEGSGNLPGSPKY